MSRFFISHWYFLVGCIPLFVWGYSKSEGLGSTSGKLVGIVGKMGSGKSLFAVRMAYRRMRSGANVRTNFSMKFPNHHPDRECPKKCDRKKRCICARKRRLKGEDGVSYRQECLCQMAKRWAPFHGWEEVAFLENAVVIVDEAHIMAPSHDFHAIPEIARWKISMGRKFKLDVYWISQNEKKVSAQLRNDTNYIFICRSWFPGMGRGGAPLLLSAKEYEPENLRKPDKHTGRKVFVFRKSVAELYDSLEVMRSDKLVARDGTMALADKITQEYNAKRRGLSRTERERLLEAAEEDGLEIEHNDDGSIHVLPGSFGEHNGSAFCGQPTKRGTPCRQPAGKCPFHKGEIQEKGEPLQKGKVRQFEL